MGSSFEGSDDTVFGGRGGTGIVADVKVGVRQKWNCQSGQG